jgi:hypothetical protein
LAGVGGEVPVVAVRVLHSGAAFAAGHVGGFVEPGGIGGERAAVGGVLVADVGVERAGPCGPLVVRLGNLDDRVADLDFDVQDLAIWPEVAADFLASRGLDL